MGSTSLSEETPLLASNRFSCGSFSQSLPYRSNEDDPERSQVERNNNYLTTTKTMMHLLKASIGIGILGLPRSLKNAGILVGPLLLCVLAVTSVHCMHLLLKCNRHLRNVTGKPVLDYGEIGKECCRKFLPDHLNYGREIVNVLICFIQFGACIGYVLFIAENLHDAMAELDAVHMKKKIYIAIILPFLLLFCLMRDLNSLFWMSWFANVLMVIVLVSIFIYLFGHVQDPTELELFAGWKDLPLSFGAATYAFEAIAIILPLQNKTRNFNQYPSILNAAMAIVIILYFNMAIFGYMTFQEKCRGSITLNLPCNNYYSTVKILVSIAIFCTYFIQIYIFFQIVECEVFSRFPEKYKVIITFMFRISTVSITCGLAAAVPHLNDIISLVGASCGSILAFVIPTIFHWILFYNDTGRLSTMKNVLIIAFGVVGSLTGTYSALRNIIKDK